MADRYGGRIGLFLDDVLSEAIGSSEGNKKEIIILYQREDLDTAEMIKSNLDSLCFRQTFLQEVDIKKKSFKCPDTDEFYVINLLQMMVIPYIPLQKAPLQFPPFYRGPL